MLAFVDDCVRLLLVALNNDVLKFYRNQSLSLAIYTDVTELFIYSCSLYTHAYKHIAELVHKVFIMFYVLKYSI